jgi:hypothetical protein
VDPLKYKFLALAVLTMLITLQITLNNTIHTYSDNRQQLLLTEIISDKPRNPYILPYIGENLTVLYHVKLMYIPIDRNPNIDLESGLADLIDEYVSGNHTCGKLISSTAYYNSTYDIVMRNMTYTNCSLTMTSIGYIYFKYGDGVVHELYILNDTMLNNTMADLSDAIYYYIPSIVELDPVGIDFSILYAGVEGEETIITHKQELELVNGSLVPVNETYIKLVNPYYKFYILFNNIRFAYPVMIGIENVNGKPLLKFLKAFIPLITYNVSCSKCIFVVNDTYLEEIRGLVENVTGLKNLSAEDIVIGDIYYAPTPDYEFMAPYIEVYVNRSTTCLHELMILRLTNAGPVVEHVLIVTGTPSPSDPSYLWIESIPYNERYKPTPECVGVIDLDKFIEVYIIMLSIFAVIVVLIWYAHRRGWVEI